MTILLVDDDDELRAVLSEILLTAGHQVIAARDGEEALFLIQDRNVDVLITDILMPNKDGLELITQFRKRFSQGLIVAISGGGDIFPGPVCLELALQLGANQVLRKPFHAKALLELVDQSA